MKLPEHTAGLIVLTEEDTAALLQVTPYALRKWRRQGCGPRFIRCGLRLIRYVKSDVDAWLNNNAFHSGAHELSAKSTQ